MINVPYKCSCMSAEVEVQVAPRREGEGIEDWLTHMQMAIGVDHRKRSPNCLATQLEYAKIPTVDHMPIGTEPKAN